MELTLGPHWTKKAIRAVGAAKISGLAQRAMRLSHARQLSKKWRAWLRKLWFAPPGLQVEEPRKWWNLIAATGLGGRAPDEQRNKLFGELNDILIFAPSDLAELGKDQLHIVSDDPDSNRLLGQLWGAVKVSNGAKDLEGGPCPSSYVLQGWGARQLANAISADSAKECELGRACSSHAADLGLSVEECDEMGPREKSGRRRKARPQQCRSPSSHRRELSLTCSETVTPAGDQPQPASDAGAASATSQPDLTPPPTDEGVLARSSLFGAGRSFKIHVSRLEKARLLLGVDTSWKRKVVTAAGYGFAKAGVRSFSPQQAIAKSQLRELVTSRSLQGDLALVALLGRPFLLRIPSECLLLCR